MTGQMPPSHYTAKYANITLNAKSTHVPPKNIPSAFLFLRRDHRFIGKEIVVEISS